MIGEAHIGDELPSSEADCRRVTKHLHHFQGESGRGSPRLNEVLRSMCRENDCVHVAYENVHVCRSSQQCGDWLICGRWFLKWKPGVGQGVVNRTIL